MQHQHRLLILYATQTGNALDAAERLAREAERRSCPNKLLSLHDYDPNLLPQEEARNLSNHWLKGVHYTVFGLGDSGYQKYNFVAKKLDKRLIDLGGTTILERGFGDDQHPSGYEGTLDPWMSSLWRMLNTIKPEFLPNGPGVVIQDTVLIDQPKVQITYHNIENIKSHFSTASDFTSPDILRSARSMHPAGHEKKRLKDFASPEGRDDLYQYNQKERRIVLEVLEDFPSVQMPFEWLIQLVPLLKTRAFSISSSQSAHPNQSTLDCECRVMDNTLQEEKERIMLLVASNIRSLRCRQYSCLVPKRFSSDTITLTSPHTCWTGNRMCAFSRIHRGKGLEK
ncbi:hypothetical protein RYX36_022681 [Vicia faba]